MGPESPILRRFLTSKMSPFQDTFEDGEEVVIRSSFLGIIASKPSFLCFILQGRAPIASLVIPAMRSDFSAKNWESPEKGFVMVDIFSLYVPANIRNNPNIDIHKITTFLWLNLMDTRSLGPIIFGIPEAKRGKTYSGATSIRELKGSPAIYFDKANCEALRYAMTQSGPCFLLQLTR